MRSCLRNKTAVKPDKIRLCGVSGFKTRTKLGRNTIV